MREILWIVVLYCAKPIHHSAGSCYWQNNLP